VVIGVSLAIRSFSVRYSFSFSMLAQPCGGGKAVIATIRNAAVENCQMIVE
jgi:hypothetical protein